MAQQSKACRSEATADTKIETRNKHVQLIREGADGVHSGARGRKDVLEPWRCVQAGWLGLVGIAAVRREAWSLASLPTSPGVFRREGTRFRNKFPKNDVASLENAEMIALLAPFGKPCV